MFTQPGDLPEQALADALDDGWALGVDALDYVAVGFGSHHWTVNAGDRRWFVTVDDLDAKRRDADDPRHAALERLRAALSASRAVADAGLEFVVAPCPTTDGAVLRPVDDRFAAAVYPHLDGSSYPYGEYSSGAHRHAVLSMLTRLHQIADPVATGAQEDDLVVPHREELRAAIDDLGGSWDSGPYGEPARRLLDRHATSVDRLFEHYDVIAGATRDRLDQAVLTHGEPHAGNTLLTSEGWQLVDWDTALIAVPERDLWIAVGDDTTIDDYQAISGRTVNHVGLECYRLGWDLIEICGYIAVLHAEHGDDTDTEESWNNLQHYLDPQARWPLLTGTVRS